MTNKTEIAEMNELVQRYSVHCHCGSVDVVQRDDGHLVMHSDYVLMEQRAERAEELASEIAIKCASYAEANIKNLDRAEKAEAKLAAIRGAAVPVAWTSQANLDVLAKKSGGVLEFMTGDKSVYTDPIPLFTQPAPLVVVLPKPLTTKLAYLRMTSNYLSGSYRDGFNDCLTRCIQAVADTGITVKSADGEG